MKTDLENAKFGDLITLMFRDRLEFRRIAHVNQLAIIDDAGDKWSIKSGKKWGECSNLYAIRIRKYRDGDTKVNAEHSRERRDKIKRTKLAMTAWHSIPIDKIDAVFQILHPEAT